MPNDMYADMYDFELRIWPKQNKRMPITQTCAHHSTELQQAIQRTVTVHTRSTQTTSQQRRLHGTDREERQGQF